MELLQQGAEGRIFIGDYKGQRCLVKERFVKNYRHPDLDAHLTKTRIKAEQKAVERCTKAGVLTPKIFEADIKDRKIYMEYLETSITSKQYIIEHGSNAALMEKLATAIGTAVGKMHANNIIHGDLTTSNMLIKPKTEDFADYDLVMIDFGLSQYSTTTEDKGVDLYVLERALLSTHSKVEGLFPKILEAYCTENAKGSKEVVAKLEEVRLRGRKRTMVG
ncbi:EKC/KEOPS complex subunit TP53RK [Culicoides brevitarsis]|uniref:EKC/KEOPS complex subunit TP53RK n=1 Tax=Culicoides brevitarsis TaxID=469753 RepID=UPI00307BF8F0